jgi:hypothetical protein
MYSWQPVPIPIAKHVLFRWDYVSFNDRDVITGNEEYEKKASDTLIPGTTHNPNGHMLSAPYDLN